MSDLHADVPLVVRMEVARCKEHEWRSEPIAQASNSHAPLGLNHYPCTWRMKWIAYSIETIYVMTCLRYSSARYTSG